MNEVLNYNEYMASIHFSSEDEIFYGKILGINDLVTFEGQTVKELKKAFKEAVDDYTATCELQGKEPEKTYKGSFNVRLSPVIHRKVALIALQKNVSLNDFVKAAISYAIEHTDSIEKLFSVLR
jgi:predicted HicB family RNase H-like nuclease